MNLIIMRMTKRRNLYLRVVAEARAEAALVKRTMVFTPEGIAAVIDADCIAHVWTKLGEEWWG